MRRASKMPTRVLVYVDAHQSAFMRSLALAVARGRSIAAWGRAKEVPVEKARGWSELPEFRLLVEKVRLEHSERMVGKLARCVGRAIERLVELSENTRHPGVSLGATKAIIEKWIHTSEHFIQAFQLKDLIAREGNPGQTHGEAQLRVSRAVQAISGDDNGDGDGDGDGCYRGGGAGIDGGPVWNKRNEGRGGKQG